MTSRRQDIWPLIALHASKFFEQPMYDWRRCGLLPIKCLSMIPHDMIQIQLSRGYMLRLSVPVWHISNVNNTQSLSATEILPMNSEFDTFLHDWLEWLYKALDDTNILLVCRNTIRLWIRRQSPVPFADDIVSNRPMPLTRGIGIICDHAPIHYQASISSRFTVVLWHHLYTSWSWKACCIDYKYYRDSIVILWSFDD